MVRIDRVKLPIQRAIEAEAMRRSGYQVTGKAARGNVVCAYYPACKRFAWYVDGNPATKKQAMDLLNHLVRNNL